MIPSDSQPRSAQPYPQPSRQNATPSAINAAASASAGIDFSRSLADSGNRSGGGAGSDLIRNAVEFQGDNFGPGSGFATISEVFSYSNVVGENLGGGLFAFEVGNDTSPNDLFNSIPATGNPLSALLDEPIDPTDADIPTEPGLSYAGGLATQNGATQGNWNLNYAYSYNRPISLPSSVTGRMKLAENVSPLPQNRVFMNYSLFNNVPLTQNGITVNRFTPGFERTFWNKLASIEVRTPFATTLDSNIFTDGSTNTRNAEFGNIFLALKGLLLASDTWALSAGLSLSLPTADDNRVYNSRDTELLRVVNQSVHVMPFIGGLYTPTRRSFVQGIMQVDIDTNGNDVLARTTPNGLNKIGKFQDSTFLYCDLAIGYWLVKRGNRDCSLIRGIIPVLEGHWNRSLNNADIVSDTDGRFMIQPPVNQLDVFNTLAGLTFQLRNKSRLSLGYVVPIGNGKDRVFDSEMRVTWNKYF